MPSSRVFLSLLILAALAAPAATVADWVQSHKLTADDGAAGDRFGCCAAVSGNTAIVGAPYDDDNGTNSGSAYVFIPEPSTLLMLLSLLSALIVAWWWRRRKR